MGGIGRAALAAAACLVAACHSGEKTPPKNDPSPADAVVPAVVPAPSPDATLSLQREAPLTTARAVNDIHFATGEGKWVRLDESGTFVAVKTLRSRWMDLELGPDESVYGTNGTSIWRLDGDVVGELPPGKGFISQLTVAGPDEVWTIGSFGVAHLEDGSWSQFEVGDLELGRLVDVAIGPDDVVWLMGYDGLARRSGASDFEAVEPPITKAPRLGHFLHPPSGELVVKHFGGVDRFSSAGWAGVSLAGAGSREKEGPGRFTGIKHAKYGGDGALVFSDYRQNCYVVRDGAYRTLSEVTRGEFPAKRILAVETDDSGRTWIATDGGLAIYESPVGNVFWPASGNSALEGQVVHMRARGKGPTVLPEVSAVRPGVVTGKLVLRGRPLSGVGLAMCREPAVDLGSLGTPCEMEDPVYSAVTGADGKFEFKDVTPGPYGIVVDMISGADYIVALGDCCMAMPAAKPLDLGTLNVARGDKVRGMSDEEAAELDDAMNE